MSRSLVAKALGLMVLLAAAQAAQAAGSGDADQLGQLRQRLTKERLALQAEMEEKKETVRKGKG